MRYAIPVIVALLIGCSEPTGITYGYDTGQWMGKDLRNAPVQCVVSADGWAYPQTDFIVSDIRMEIEHDSAVKEYTAFQSTVPISMNSFTFDTLTIHGLPVRITATYDHVTQRWEGYRRTEWPCGEVFEIAFYLEHQYQ